MLERWTGRLLVALDEPAADAETQKARWALLSGRRCVARGEGPAARLAALGGLELLASFFDRSAHFDRIVAQTANPRLAQVFARRHIDGQMLFNESYRLRTRLIPLGEADIVLRTLATTELACARAADALPLATRPVRLAALEETALAALAAKATSEPALVCFARGERFVAFLAEAGDVRGRQLAVVPPGDAAEQEAAVGRAAAAFGGGTGLPEPAVTLLFGDLTGLAKQPQFARDVASREVEKKIAALVAGANALAEPELFGLPFVRREWNLLEPAQAAGALAWKLALPAAGLLVAGAAFAGLLGGFQAIDNAATAARLQEQRATLERERGDLVKRIPDEKESRRLAEFAELMKKRDEQVRADRLLAWLTTRLPEGAVVESVTLYPFGEKPPEAAQGPGAKGGEDILARIFGRDKAAEPKAQPEKASAKNDAGRYAMRLVVSLPGGYEEVEPKAAATVRALAEGLSFEQAVLDYDAKETRARFHLAASLTARSFAP
ncbi:MAG: hypothetical protein N3C63_05680 [Rhodocyclaceae bacterium]|nr:hypothetical protein [Rhodocyclaceae bacterium]